MSILLSAFIVFLLYRTLLWGSAFKEIQKKKIHMCITTSFTQLAHRCSAQITCYFPLPLPMFRLDQGKALFTCIILLPSYRLINLSCSI